jgi:uncharacterized protein
MSFRKLKVFIIQKLQSEIPQTLSYHGVHHTLEVLEVCNQYIKRLKIAKREAELLRTAALLHDTGFIWTYTKHEERGVSFAREILPDWGFHENEIDRISKMILATRIPQKPQNLLEEILCDADLDYLGTNRFYTIGSTLYRELLTFKLIDNEDSWDKIQINFLSHHRYHTKYGKKYREPQKRHNLESIFRRKGFQKEDIESDL